MNSVICFGEVLWDMLPTGAQPGGAPLNVSVHLKKQGQNPVLISKVGNDENGKRLLQFLKNSGINSKFIQIDDELPTSEVLVHLDENKNARFEICEPVAWDAIKMNNQLKQLLKSAGLIIFGSLIFIPNRAKMPERETQGNAIICIGMPHKSSGVSNIK